MSLLRDCTPTVNDSLCKGCGVCVEVCPKGALALSGLPGSRGYRYPVYKGGCVGCRLCEWFCPDFAIAVGCRE